MRVVVVFYDSTCIYLLHQSAFIQFDNSYGHIDHTSAGTIRRSQGVAY